MLLLDLNLEKAKQVQIIPLIPKEWRLSLDLTIHGTNVDWANVFQFTQGGSCCSAETRIPAIFVYRGSTKIQVCFGINGLPVDANCKNSPKEIGLNVKTKIEIQQRLDLNNEYTYSIRVNNISNNELVWVYSVVNRQAKVFSNVILYMSSPFEPTADVTVQNFLYETFEGNRYFK